MENILREYDAKIDNKKRLTIRLSLFDHYHIKEYDDGCILLEPRELVEPFCISDNTLHIFDSSVSNLKKEEFLNPMNIVKTVFQIEL